MRLPHRRPEQVPADVLAAAPLSRGERVLASAEDRDGGWLLGTRDALLLLPAGGAPARVPWQQVERADWDREQDLLVVTEVGEFGRVRPRHTATLDEPGRLLELVRERVTASVVLQRRVEVTGERGLFVVARRAPRGDGEITWAFECDPGVDPNDPAVARAMERGLAAAREELGL